MKKVLLIILAGLFVGGEGLAAELVIHLKSGNSLIVKYTGTIEGVAMYEGEDAIAGLEVGESLNRSMPEQRFNQKSIQPQPNEDAQKKGDTIRFKWAEPKIED